MSTNFPPNLTNIASFLSLILPEPNSETPVLDISQNFGLVTIALAIDAFVHGSTPALSILSNATQEFIAAMDSFVSPQPHRDLFPHPSWSQAERAFIIDTVTIIASALSAAHADPDHFPATTRLVAATPSTATDNSPPAFLITLSPSFPS
jgi:hypothetical protein